MARQSVSFSKQLFKDAAKEDVNAIAPATRKAIIKSAEKAVGKTVVSVRAAGPETLVVVSLKNRPFIVDSVLAELNSHDLQSLLVIHPVIDGHSLVIVVMEETDTANRKAIEAGLKHVISQVRMVTDDWKPMLARIAKRISDYRKAPPPLPTEKLAEAVQFLEWLSDNNFTLMGIREYRYSGTPKSGQLERVPGSALGITKDKNLHLMTRGGEPVELTPEIRAFLFSDDPLIITKANVKSKVHRRTHLDYIGIKSFDNKGQLTGELLIVGLFTSTAYTKSVMSIPVLRHKAFGVLKDIGADPVSHSGKALINILENWPRDDMFQIERAQLGQFARQVVRLEERQRICVLPRLDKFDRFVSVLAFVPRDRYDSQNRAHMGDYLAQAYDGYLSAFYPTFLENGMVRVQFIIGRSHGKTPKIKQAAIEAHFDAITRTWAEELSGTASAHDYPIAYQEHTDPDRAVIDAGLLEGLTSQDQIAIDFYYEDGPSEAGLKLFHLSTSVPLSQRVPLLENMGFRVIEEFTYEITRADGEVVFLHDMTLQTANGADIDHGETDELLEETLHAVWAGKTSNDSFNALVLTAGLTWQQAGVLRAYAGYLRQLRSRFTTESMATTLAKETEITTRLIALFEARFNPDVKSRERKLKAASKKIDGLLDAVQSSDDDRILRNFANLIQATLRTNFYSPVLQSKGSDNAPAPVLAFKVDPSAVNTMPQPVPYREIFVSAPRVEGLHLRFGPIARGGLRWSDRAQDYRTEVLGLVKAQQVKNAVIVPVGSKGGFVPKQLPGPGDRNAWFEEGKTAYKIFIASLLSLTDNLVQGKVVPPKRIVRHDGDDPYFVVAADKGTSTFSDTANAISQERDFWLDDAFASGGSAGYDHKKMGITARGGWEAVKRHFREMEKDGKSWDIQSQPFTAAGVGDMSGDVFGNGMLLSNVTRLIAAFDHRDIFIDPDPDPARSFKERERLFKKDRSSWQDYTAKLISKGGGVFSRSAKKINLSKQAAEAIGFKEGNFTPQEIMNAILKAPVDLMWFGGIGTYIRASHESDADAGDRGNDSIRVTAKELRCKVIGEGANLGVTQPARIEFNLRGGRCNSDAIDNSAGVNSSDVEVNIKIALAAAMKSGRLTRPKRDRLLESMTESVAELVLRNNYLQTLAISLAERDGLDDFGHQQRLMQALESRGLLDRDVEDLPDDAMMAERRAAGHPLTRAELGVILAYAKIVALDDLVAGDVPDDPYLTKMLFGYFPPKMQKTYAKEISQHQLRREIIGTVVANSMVNRGGPSFINRVAERTSADIDTIARAYVAVRDTFDMQKWNTQIDALDAKIAGDLQLELYGILKQRVISQTVWFVRNVNFTKGLSGPIGTYKTAIDKLMPKLEKYLPEFLADRIAQDTQRYEDGGVPAKTALGLARMPIAGLIPDIQFAALETNQTLETAATAFFRITEEFRIGRIVNAARNIAAEDYYDGLALDRAVQSLHRARRDLTIEALKNKRDIRGWLASKGDAVEQARNQMLDIIEGDQGTVSRITVAANILADLARD